MATEGPLGWSALRAARRLGIPAATGFHTRFDDYVRSYGAPWLEGTALRWMRHFHNGAQATLVPTRELQGFLQAQRFRNVVQLPRAVDTAAFHPDHRDEALRRALGPGSARARGDPRRPHRAGEEPAAGRARVPRTAAGAPGSTLRLGRRRPRARGPAARESGLRLLPACSAAKHWARHFASGDLFLFPSRSETFGNVTLEALASGVPVVAFDYGAAREFLRDGVHGAAVALHDDAGFLAAALRLAGDDALRARMRHACRDAVAGLRPARVAEAFDHLLQSLATRSAHHAATAVS